MLNLVSCWAREVVGRPNADHHGTECNVQVSKSSQLSYGGGNRDGIRSCKVFLRIPNGIAKSKSFSVNGNGLNSHDSFIEVV